MVQNKLDSNTTCDDLVIKFSNEIKHKVVLVTGISPGGLGAWFVEAIARASPRLLILASRDVSKAQATAMKIKEAKDSVETRILQLDTASLKSVRKAADEIQEFPEAIDVLVNNIGIMATPYSKTEDGFESQWQTNYLGPFLFTNLIIDKVLASGPDARVVNVSSDGYRGGGVRYHDYNFHDGESYNPWIAYAASKTALILYTKELARRLGEKGLTTVSICPGAVITGLQGHGATEVYGAAVSLFKMLGDLKGWSLPKVLAPNKGIRNHVFAAFAPEIKDCNGCYFSDLEQLPEAEQDMAPWAAGWLEAEKTWELSEKLVNQKFDI